MEPGVTRLDAWLVVWPDHHAPHLETVPPGTLLDYAAFQLFQGHEMANICKIFRLADQEAVRAAFASNATDRQLAQRFGVSHAAIGRHRRAHILRPMAAAVAALDRGRSQRQQREQQLAAIEQGDPVAIATAIAAFSKTAQLGKVTEAEGNLRGLFDEAKRSGSVTAATGVVREQLKSIEVGAKKIAQVGGYGAPRAIDGKPGERRIFSISIHFAGSGRTEEFSILENRTGQEDTDSHEDALNGRVTAGDA